MANADDGETTDHPEFWASLARIMKDTHIEEKLDEAYKVFNRQSSGYTNADKLHYVCSVHEKTS